MGIFHGLGKLLGTTNDTHVETFKGDNNAYNYGGYAGGANDATARDQYMGQDAQGRHGALVDNSQFNSDRDLEMGGRGDQAEAYNATRDAMNGVGTSVAQQQLSAGLGRAQAANAATVSGARGGGANLAAAQRLGAEQSAGLAQGANSDAAMLRANEIATARGQLGGMANAIRQGDQSRAGMAAQNAQFGAGLQQQQHGLNDAFQLGMEGYGNQVQSQQLQAQENRNKQAAANYYGANSINSGAEGDNAKSGAAGVGGAAGAAGAIAQGVSSSDANAKRGIMSEGNAATNKLLDEAEHGSTNQQYGASPPPPAADGKGAGATAGDAFGAMGKSMSGGGGDSGSAMASGMTSLAKGLTSAFSSSDMNAKMDAHSEGFQAGMAASGGQGGSLGWSGGQASPQPPGGIMSQPQPTYGASAPAPMAAPAGPASFTPTPATAQAAAPMALPAPAAPAPMQQMAAPKQAPTTALAPSAANAPRAGIMSSGLAMSDAAAKRDAHSEGIAKGVALALKDEHPVISAVKQSLPFTAASEVKAMADRAFDKDKMRGAYDRMMGSGGDMPTTAMGRAIGADAGPRGLANLSAALNPSQAAARMAGKAIGPHLGEFTDTQPVATLGGMVARHLSPAATMADSAKAYSGHTPVFSGQTLNGNAPVDEIQGGGHPIGGRHDVSMSSNELKTDGEQEGDAPGASMGDAMSQDSTSMSGGGAGGGGGGMGILSSIGLSPDKAAAQQRLLNPHGSFSDKGYYESNRGGNQADAADKYQKDISTLVSDKNAKTGIMKETLADKFLDGLHPASYRYKDPQDEPGLGAPGGRYLGIMAQDAEKIPEIGSQLVVETSRGKAMAQKPLLSAVTAGLARVNERLRAIEGSKGKRA